MRFASVCRLVGFALGLALASLASPASAELVSLSTPFGPITVERDFGGRVQPLLARLYAAGVRGNVKCYAPRPAPGRRGPHVKNSLHYWGGACDVLPLYAARRGRNRMPTPPLMHSRTVAHLIAEAGLRNGCSFRDCGHVDAGGRASHTRVARSDRF